MKASERVSFAIKGMRKEYLFCQNSIQSGNGWASGPTLTSRVDTTGSTTRRIFVKSSDRGTNFGAFSYHRFVKITLKCLHNPSFRLLVVGKIVELLYQLGTERAPRFSGRWNGSAYSS